MPVTNQIILLNSELSEFKFALPDNSYPLGTYHFFLLSCPDRQAPFSYAHAVASLFPSCSQDFA